MRKKQQFNGIMPIARSAATWQSLICFPMTLQKSGEIATFPLVARNGHKGHKLLLLLYISFKHPKYNQLLMKKILLLNKLYRECFLLSLLNTFNKNTKIHLYDAYLIKNTNMINNIL